MESTLISCIKSHGDIKGELNIYPLPHLKVIKDLIGDLSNLYKQYESIQPWLKTSKTDTEKQEIYNPKMTELNSMDIMSVFYVPAALHRVQATGGMVTNI